MVPGSSQAVVLPKFDMHVHTSILTFGELKDAVNEYCIPGDLHPRLSPPALTMNKLPFRYIGLYIKQLEQGVTRHWFSFESKTGGRSKKCFKEITSSLKGWKKKFFLIDRPSVFSLTFFFFSSDHDGCLIEASSLDQNRCKQRVKNLEKPNPKITVAKEKNKAKALAKLQAKRAREGASEAPRKKRKVRPNQEPDLSGSEKTLSPTPLHQAAPQNEEEPATANTGLRDDLRICTFRACKELVSHLETPAEEEFLGNLTNAEVMSRAYQSLGQYVLSQGELLKRHKQLNHDYVDLRNRSDVRLVELNCLRNSLQNEMQANDGLNKRLALLDSAHSSCLDRERELMDMLKDMEKALENEKAYLETRLAQADVDRQQLVWEFIPSVVKRLHTSVEYQKSLAVPVSLCFTAGWLGGLSLGRTEDQIATMLSETRDLDITGSKSWEARHRELFTMQCPYVQKVDDSYHLSIVDLMKVSSDVPLSPTNKTGTSTAEETVAEATFSTTT
ncbi:hypothetical protein Tco_0540488 [Tanacetum coccineum]